MSHRGKITRKSKKLSTVRQRTASVSKATKMHHKRPAGAQEMDDELVAEVAPFAEWRTEPNRKDMVGVDLFPIETKKGDLDHNVSEFKQRLADYYTGISPDVEIYTSNNAQEFSEILNTKFNARYSLGLKGMHSSTNNRIVVDPTCTEILHKGEVSSPADFDNLNTLVHEITHNTRSVKGHDRGKWWAE